MRKNREKSVELLNAAIADELSAIHQYMYFHFHLDDLGYTPLSNLLKKVAIEEMQHAEQVAERLLFLGGEVEMKPSAEVEKITDPAAMVERAMELEEEAIEMYNRYASQSGENGDSGTKKLFENLVEAEEGHWDLFDRQADHIKRFGERYLALQSFDSSGGGGEAPA